MYDIIVVGGGPAGMTAALYALRNGKTALVLEKNGFGGQITHSPKVENWPGTARMSGNEYADAFLEQILDQGAEVDLTEVVRVEKADGCLRVITEDGEEKEAKAVILATGVKHRMLGLPGEEDLVGEGISYCAVCDGDFYKGKTVCVAGGGNSALQEAILLASKCAHVTMLQDLPSFTGEQKLQEVLFARDNVSALTGVRITDVTLDENAQMTGVTVRKADGETETVPCDGLFVAIGLIPENEAFAGLAELNQWGYFDSGESCETKTPGVYVAGDCRSKGVRQLTTAVADGATAALAACRYIDGL
ncbi:MAG: FAD-dependent oxidoreductase [Clostridia bacterium]|nr:FAD-dependent oxidoreductase [Clostridia bacterium]